MHCMKTKYLISNLNSKGTSIGKLAVSAIVGMMLSSELFAAINNNEYVTVESTTPGVEEIYAVRDDFYVTTRGVSSPPFAADIEVTANSPWYLKRPRSGHLHLAIGENDEYQVGDGSSSEEGPGGRIYVLKLDIEQQETNVCWGSTSCKLNLTDDSWPGGEVAWASFPGGISGSGNSITFNPSAVMSGEYAVMAWSKTVPEYMDTCVVRIIRIVTRAIAQEPSNRTRKKIGIGEEVVCYTSPVLANIEWSVDCGGTLSTRFGAITIFNADMRECNAVINARVANIDCSETFVIVEPMGLRVLFQRDSSFGRNGSSFMWAGSLFDCTVLPEDVSFYNVVFRENILGESFVWPDGTQGTREHQFVVWNVDFGNKNTDYVSTVLQPVSRLFNGVAFVDFNYNVRVPEEFCNSDGTWVTWLPNEAHPRSFRGADKKSKVELKATNTATGGWMGPWE